MSYRLILSLKKKYDIDSTWQELFKNPVISRFLKEELDMEIPRQYWNRTVKELAETLSSEAEGGKLEKLETFLKIKG
ncbi:MAG: hypothetical protein K1W40_01545 [Schaedlerella sp.]|uniref:hypothetical protein n=1 Tax=Schaedlerella sp. TaxID=2676057 RepID=UPI003529B37B